MFTIDFSEISPLVPTGPPGRAHHRLAGMLLINGQIHLAIAYAVEYEMVDGYRRQISLGNQYELELDEMYLMFDADSSFLPIKWNDQTYVLVIRPATEEEGVQQADPTVTA